jgi:hypothetical protein
MKTLCDIEGEISNWTKELKMNNYSTFVPGSHLKSITLSTMYVILTGS